MKQISIILVFAIITLSCSLFVPTSSEHPIPRFTTALSPTATLQPTDSPNSQFIGKNIIPVYWDTPQQEIEEVGISVAEEGKYIAVYLDPLESSGIPPQFLFLKSGDVDEDQIVGLLPELHFTDLGDVEVDPDEWAEIGILTGDQTIEEYRQFFGESDLVLFGIQDPSLINSDLSNFTVNIYDSPFPKVKYGLIKNPYEVNLNGIGSNRFISLIPVFVNVTAIHIPWNIFGNLLLDRVDIPTRLSMIILKFMCGTTSFQVGPCQSSEIIEAYQEQYSLLHPERIEVTDLESTVEPILETEEPSAATEVPIIETEETDIQDPEIKKYGCYDLNLTSEEFVNCGINNYSFDANVTNEVNMACGAGETYKDKTASGERTITMEFSNSVFNPKLLDYTLVNHDPNHYLFESRHENWSYTISYTFNSLGFIVENIHTYDDGERFMTCTITSRYLLIK